MWEAENVGSSWKISSFRFPKISCTQMYIWDSQEFGTDFNFLDKYSFKMLLNFSIFWRILTFSKILKFSGIPKFSNCEILSEPDLSRSNSSRPDPSRYDPIWIDSTRTSGSRYFQFLAHLCVQQNFDATWNELTIYTRVEKGCKGKDNFNFKNFFQTKIDG